MKKIKLNKGYYCLIDNDDYSLISKYKWYINGIKKIYAIRTKEIGSRRSNIKRKVLHFSMHREIMKAQKGQQVDHINGNTLDNRKCNLRICTNQQNSFNRTKTKRNKSGFKGVRFLKRLKSRPYTATIMINYKNKHLGYFKTAENAALAYNEAAIKYFGKFANLNIIKG